MGHLRILVVGGAIGIIGDEFHVKILDAKVYIIECVLRCIHLLKLITCIGLLNFNAAVAQRSLLAMEDFVYSGTALMLLCLLVRLLLLFTRPSRCVPLCLPVLHLLFSTRGSRCFIALLYEGTFQTASKRRVLIDNF